MLVLITSICLISRRSLRLPLRHWLHCIGLGVLLIPMTYGNIGSVEFISVSLAALLFYTFPPIVAVIHALVLRERLPLPKWLAVGLAFSGLALMLGVSLADSDIRGVALALAASFATAWNAVWLARKLPHTDTLVVTLHLSLVATPLMFAVTILSGNLQWPSNLEGWLGMTGVTVLQAGSLPFYFLAIMRIGALKAAMVSNVQPLTSIIAAFILFGEALSPPQWLGGAMVLFGIWLMQWFDARLKTSLGN